MSYRFLIIALLISIVSQGQEEIATINHYLPKKNRNTKEFHSFYNEKDGNTLIFSLDRKTLYAYLVDKDFKEVHKGISTPYDERLMDVDGISGDGDTYSIFTSLQGRKDWQVVKLDFSTQTGETIELDLKLKGGNPITHFTSDKHHILSLDRNSSIIKLYQIDLEGNVVMIPYDLSYFDFGKGRRTISNLERLIRTTSDNFNASFIDTSETLSLKSTNAWNKVYAQDDVITFVTDQREELTYLIQLNTITKKSSVSQIDKPELDGYGSKSNSLVFDDKLFTVKANSDGLKFSIFNLDDGNLLKEFSIEDNEEITFKNTEIIQEGGTFDNHRELERTSQFLRKVAQSSPAVSVYQQEGDYIVTLGGAHEKDPGSAIIAGTLVGGLVGIVVVSAVVGSTSGLFSDYAGTKSTRFQTILNDELEHKVGAVIPKNRFDSIKQFLETYPKKASTSILRGEDSYYVLLLEEGEETVNFKIFQF